MIESPNQKIAFSHLPESEKSFYEKITLGLPSALKKVSGVHKVEIQRKKGCTEDEVLSWEMRNDCRLPEDLRNFYKSTDGFYLTWGYKMTSDVIPIGKLAINRLSCLNKLYNESLLALSPVVPHDHPRFDRLTDKIFALDYTRDGCYPCLVYMGHKDEYSIWLLDRSLEWHFLSSTFNKYFRVMLIHQGLPQWQLMLTPVGMAPWAEQLAYSMAQNVVYEGETRVKAQRGEPSKVSPEIQFLVNEEKPLKGDVAELYTLPFDDGSNLLEDLSITYESGSSENISDIDSDTHLDAESDIFDEFIELTSEECIADVILPTDEMPHEESPPPLPKIDYMEVLQSISKMAGCMRNNSSANLTRDNETKTQKLDKE
ncbi:tubulin polyglutamylase complex subunit 2-like [Cimex lectularius]|uniref:Knr4/Smi1-like domain-containing protein n=1 Tax=Cimex lectularius TaxID=79782 RepID=A0A8I6SH39_CIMLE|nr:tubulin polyglutamylase complex subunit 2-like [Cimex lectularius]